MVDTESLPCEMVNTTKMPVIPTSSMVQIVLEVLVRAERQGKKGIKIKKRNKIVTI